MSLSETGKCKCWRTQWLQVQFGAIVLIHIKEKTVAYLCFCTYKCQQSEKGKWHHSIIMKNVLTLLTLRQRLKQPQGSSFHILRTAALATKKRQKGICRYWCGIVTCWKFCWNSYLYLTLIDHSQEKVNNLSPWRGLRLVSFMQWCWACWRRGLLI